MQDRLLEGGRSDNDPPCNQHSGGNYCTIQYNGNLESEYTNALNNSTKTYIRIEFSMGDDLCNTNPSNNPRIVNNRPLYYPFRCEGRDDAPNSNCVYLKRIGGGGTDKHDYLFMTLDASWGKLESGEWNIQPFAYHNFSGETKCQAFGTILFVYDFWAVFKNNPDNAVVFINAYKQFTQNTNLQSNGEARIYVKTDGYDANMEFKIWNYYIQLCNDLNKDPFKDTSSSPAFCTWLSKPETMRDYLGEGQWSLPSYTDTQGNRVDFIEHHCSLITGKACDNNAPVCTKFHSHENINLRGVCNSFRNYINENRNVTQRPTNAYDALIKRICASGTAESLLLGKNGECACASRDQPWNTDYQEAKSLFSKYGQASAEVMQAPTCWYAPCGDIVYNWIDSNAYPPGNPPTCGNVKYCNKPIDVKNSVFVDQRLILKNIGCGCTSDQDCTEGRKCREGRCVVCVDNEDCPTGFYCKDDMCVECEQDSDCKTGTCHAGKCYECKTSSDCKAGQYCVGNMCIECNDDNPCSSGQRCINNVCVECIEDSDCSNGRVCRNNTCQSTDVPPSRGILWWLLGGGVLLLLIILLLVIIMSRRDEEEYY